MLEVSERHYLSELSFPRDRLGGLGVTRHGYARPTHVLPVIEAGHPTPDQAGLQATEEVLRHAQSATEADHVLVLLSGGASANWIAPASGITLAEKQAVTRALLRCGANIGEINTVRKHLSRIKGGRLAAASGGACILTLAISDVPGDDPAVIGSGPTVPDPSTLGDAREVAARYRLDLPPATTQALSDPRNETPKPGDPAFARARFSLIARPLDAFRAVENIVAASGYECIFLGDRVEGEAREVAAEHVALAREVHAQGRKAVIVSGGELTVTMRGQGRGGPNQEYALAAAVALEGMSDITVLAADTDGMDGGSGGLDTPAGAVADCKTVATARANGLDPAQFLADNDSTGFFLALGDGLLTPGPTFTNVNDFRAILIDAP